MNAFLNSWQTRLALMILAASLAGLACAGGEGGSIDRVSPESQLVEGTLEHGGRQREYLLLLPSGYQSTDSYPLVLALHGGGGTAGRMCSLAAGIQTLADREGFLVVCPQGVEDHWNDGRRIENYTAHEQEVDDVGYLTALIERLTGQFSIDPERIFVTGFSNGGMMSFRFGCERADRIAAIAPVISNMPVDLECRPSQPLAVLILNGTDDPLMPFDGGQVGTDRNPLGPVMSAEDSAQFWAAHNACDQEPVERNLPVQDPDDPSRIREMRFQNCQEEANVWLYIVESGGHTWPGGPQYAPEIVVGPSTNQADSAQLIWDFFNTVGRAGS